MEITDFFLQMAAQRNPSTETSLQSYSNTDSTLFNSAQTESENRKQRQFYRLLF